MSTSQPLLERPGIPLIAAPGISYFTPAQDPPSGTASDPQASGKAIPQLFTPLQIRSVRFQNRIMLSPLCQYSADDGHLSPWHLAHLGGIISRGPGLAMIEATAVAAEGRITPQDAGIWRDSQVDAPWGLKAVVEFAHSQGQKIGIQLAHAGRKASTVAPWLSRTMVAPEDVGGWPKDIVGPSAVAFSEDNATPRAMSLADIAAFKAAWVAGVQRAVRAGFDVIEIHNAHGYLLHSFLSPASNQRTDEYGGSFENRVRLTLEIVDLTRANIPDGMPLFLRLSASDWLDVPGSGYTGESWTCEESARLALLLAARGVDLLDVSSGGNHPDQKITGGKGFQAPFAKLIKKTLGQNGLGDKMLVGTVGTIVDGVQAEDILTGKGGIEGGDERILKKLESEGAQAQELDLVIVGRMFQKNPGLVWTWAEELGVEIFVANQIGWGFGPRPKGVPKKA